MDNISNYFVDALPNNHWLNTISIYLSQKATGIVYNEFVIRLPNIVCYMLFLALCILLVRKKNVPVWAYALLLFSYLINEFFGMARGYGMAVMLIAFAFYYYWQWRSEKNNKYLSISILFLLVSGFAITFSIIWLISIGITAIFVLWKEKQLKDYLTSRWYLIILFLAAAFVILLYQYLSTLDKPGPPMTLNYFEFLRGFFMVIIPNIRIASVLIIIAIAIFLISLAIFCRKIADSIFVFPFLIMLGVLVILSLTGIGMPTGRGILIFYVPFVFTAMEVTGWWVNSKKSFQAIYPVLSCCITVVLIVVFLKYSANNHAEETIIRDRAYTAIHEDAVRKEIISERDSPSVTFYRDKIIYYNQADIFAEDGVMKPGWIHFAGGWKFYDVSGVMKTGWLQEGSKWYYLNPASGLMVIGTKNIDGRTSTFAESGVWLGYQ
jgi:hypothetical protein